MFVDFDQKKKEYFHSEIDGVESTRRQNPFKKMTTQMSFLTLRTKIVSSLSNGVGVALVLYFKLMAFAHFLQIDL